MEIVKATINGHFEMMLPKHRAERPEWYYPTGWEKARLESMYDEIVFSGHPEKEVVYYVGAELGEMPALCAMWDAQVVLFEPNDKAWPVIKQTFDANNVKPKAFFKGFASDVTKLIHDPFPMFEWPPEVDREITTEHGFNQLYQEADSFNQIKIDDYVALSLLIPTVITMDVEGSEGRVLRGAVETIKKYKPKLWLSIHPEFLITQYGEWSYELRQWLRGLGYKETILDYQHELHVFYDSI